MRTIRLLIILSAIIGYALLSFAQNESDINENAIVVPQEATDSLEVEVESSEVVDSAYRHVMDSLLRADRLQRDSIARADSMARADSLRA